MTDEESPRPRRRWRSIAIGLAVVVLFFVPALLPTRLGAVSREHPPIEDRSGRKPRADAARPPPNVTSVVEEEVSFPSSIPEKGLKRLKGALQIPVGPAGKRPAVVILHASGGIDRDGALGGDLLTRHEPFEVYRALGDFFAREGFVVLRWDKRGSKAYSEAERDEAVKKLEYGDYARDGRDAIDWLATRAEVDPDAVVVVGHSEGGFVAPDVARDNPHVAAVVLLAPFIGIFEGGATQLEEYARIRRAQLDLVTSTMTSLTASSRRKCIALARSHLRPQEKCLEPLDNEQVSAAVAYSEHTKERLAALRVPVFALQGSVDRNVSPDTMLRIRDVLRGPDHDVEVHYVPNVTHLLVDVVEREGPPAIADDVKRRLHVFLGSIRGNAL